MGELREAGFTVVELLVALLVGFLVLHAGWTVLRVQGDAVARAVETSEAVEAGRVVHDLLRRELRAGRPGRDWRVPGGDSIPIRAFRGTGIPCPDAGAGDDLRVRYRGVRLPDPEKDSLLVLEGTGVWAVRALERRGATSEPCPGTGEGRVEAWRVPGLPVGVVLARVFERGSYHLARGALRYRRGRGGRQPVTAEVLGDDGTGVGMGGGGGAVVRLRFRRRGGGSGRDPVRSVIWPREGGR